VRAGSVGVGTPDRVRLAGDDGGVADDLRVNSWLVIPASELSERFSRSSGPGGQSVNTTDSRVELSFDVRRSRSLPEHARERALRRLASRLTDGVLTVTASAERSQLLNRLAARERLTALLREAIAPPAPPRVPTRPGRAARERRLQDKRRRAQTKRNRRFSTGSDELRQGACRDRCGCPPRCGRENGRAEAQAARRYRSTESGAKTATMPAHQITAATA
jgi:ribosome-associated protein